MAHLRRQFVRNYNVVAKGLIYICDEIYHGTLYNNYMQLENVVTCNKYIF